MVDFQIYQGDQFKRNLFILEDSVAVDSTGYTLYMTIKSSLDDTDDDALLQKSFTPSIALSGKFIINLTSAETALLTVTTSVTKYYFDLRLKDDSSENRVLMAGDFRVLQPSTRTFAR